MNKNEMVEIEEYYENGVVVKVKANGIDMPLPPFQFCKAVSFTKVMSREEAQKMFGPVEISKIIQF